MVGRSQVGGVSLRETLSTFTTNNSPKDGSASAATNSFLKAISTSCRALGHTSEIAQAARKGYFSYSDHFGLNQFFLTVTQDDQRSFRVRLYIRVGDDVSEEHKKYFQIFKNITVLIPRRSLFLITTQAS